MNEDALLMIGEINIVPVKPRDGLVAFASCVINKQLFIGNIAIYTALSGEHPYRLVYPSKTLPNGKQINCIHPVLGKWESRLQGQLWRGISIYCQYSFKLKCEEDVAMSRRKIKAPPFVMLRRDLLKDRDWRNLTSSTKVVYIYLRSKFNHITLSRVSLAYSELSDMLSAKTISKAFKELIRAGFIEKVKRVDCMGGCVSMNLLAHIKTFITKGDAYSQKGW